MTETYLIESISDDYNRYCLVKHDQGWSAEWRVRTEAGGWFTAWATAILPNRTRMTT